MRRRIEFLTIGLLVVAVAASCSSAVDDGKGEGDGQGDAQRLRVAVVTGSHAFDVPNFYRMLRELPGVDAYPQHLEHFASSPPEVRDAYDAVVFFGMHRGEPQDDGPRYAGQPKAAVERLVERGQGIVILHHALLAWEKWDLWNQLTGFENRNFKYKEGLQLNVEIADRQHPITQGLDAMEIVDEGYILHGQYDGQGRILLNVDHENAMTEVGWARQQDKCRVFCLALGHDNQAWSNPAFQTVLARAVAWSAGDDE